MTDRPPAGDPTFTAPPAVAADGATRTAFPSLVARTASFLPDRPVTHVLPTAPPGYELFGELGRGGMGVVYRARQVRLNREVALKVILAGAHASDAHRERFVREAEAAAALNHPNVVHVYEVGEHSGLPYMALELCPGGTLADRLAGNPLPPTEAAALVELLARAVESAHMRGIVHRDLKSANVLLTTEGQPKVADFGLAKVADSDWMTATGAVFGTPSYMSPEQARGDVKSVGTSTDVYALGAILYECLTGRPPFRAASAAETLYQVLHQEPARPRDVNPTVPVDLETVCLKCLEKDPGRRYPSARALADEVERFVRGLPVTARPVGVAGRLWRWRRRNPGIAAALAIAVTSLVIGTAAAIGFGIWAAASADAARAEARRADEEARRAGEKANAERDARAEAQHLVGLLSTEQGVAAAGTGDFALGLLRIAYALKASADSPQAVSWARTLFGSHWGYGRPPFGTLVGQWQIAGQAPDEIEPSWLSRDATRLVVVDGTGAACVWDTSAGRQTARLCDPAGPVDSATLSADGRRAVTRTSDGRPQVWDVITGRPVTVLDVDGVFGDVAFSPDGRRIGVVGLNALTVYDATTWRVTAKAELASASVEHIRFTPDGSHVVGVGRGGAVVWDAATGHPRASAAATTDLFAARLLAMSPDGHRVLTLESDTVMRVWDLVTGRVYARHPYHFLAAHRAAFSPDGRFVATAEWDGPVKVWAADTGVVVSTAGDHYRGETHVAFSPDGRRVVSGGEDGIVRVCDATSGRPVSPVLHAAGSVRGVWFSPGGDRVTAVDATGLVRTWGAPPLNPNSSYALLGHCFGPNSARTGTVLWPLVNTAYNCGTHRTAARWGSSGVSVTPRRGYRSARMGAGWRWPTARAESSCGSPPPTEGWSWTGTSVG
jgi:eukaryotic-like serine/threonine-protein kinase